MITSKVTSRGQTTLPRQVRNALQSRPGQSLIYELTEDGVLIRAHPGALASFAALKPKGKDFDHGKARESAREDWAQHASEEGQ